MALTKLFMSFIWVGQLYYGLANLLKVCASNLILSTSNLRYRKIMYKVDLGWGVVSKPWIQIHKINLQEWNISLIPSSGFMEMGYKHYNWHCNWICMFFGQNLGYALLQESLVCVEHMSDNYVIISSLWQDRSCGSTWQMIVYLFLWLGHVNYGSATVLNMATKWKEFMREEMAWTPLEAPGG